MAKKKIEVQGFSMEFLEACEKLNNSNFKPHYLAGFKEVTIKPKFYHVQAMDFS